MKTVELTSYQAYEIPDADGLDSIRFMLQDVGPGAGRLLVECYGEAWATYWGGMGQRTIREFLSTCSGVDYVVNCLLSPRKNRSKATEVYLSKIVAAVLTAIRSDFMD